VQTHISHREIFLPSLCRAEVAQHQQESGTLPSELYQQVCLSQLPERTSKLIQNALLQIIHILVALQQHSELSKRQQRGEFLQK
jgi:hypothetical protein